MSSTTPPHGPCPACPRRRFDACSSPGDDTRAIQRPRPLSRIGAKTMTTTQPVPSSTPPAATATDAPDDRDSAVGHSALVAGIGLLVLAVLAGAATFGAIQHLVTPG